MTPAIDQNAYFVIDRFEGSFAAVELPGGAQIDLPVWMLPPGAREGDLVRAQVTGGDEEGKVTLRVDAAATAARREVAARRLRRLRAQDPGGDIDA